MTPGLVSFLAAIGLLVGFGILVWQLWRARTEGKILGRYGGDIIRSDNPVAFWITAGIYALIVSMFVLFAISVSVFEIIKLVR